MSEQQYGGFSRRFMAAIIDAFIFGFALGCITIIGGEIEGVSLMASIGRILLALDHMIYAATCLKDLVILSIVDHHILSHFFSRIASPQEASLYHGFSTYVVKGFYTYILWSAYHAGFEQARYKGSPGKMLMRLQVVDLDAKPIRFWHAFGRRLAGLFSLALLGGGFLWIMVSRRKRGLHDYIADTLVIMKKPQQAVVRQEYPLWYS